MRTLFLAVVLSVFFAAALPVAAIAQEENEVLEELSSTAPPPSRSAARAPVLDAVYVQTFVPTRAYDGQSLEGMTPVSGGWLAEDGDYVGTVEEGGTALLMLDTHSLQDLAFSASFACGEGCKPGLFIYGQSNGDQTSGVLYSFAQNETGGYYITLDASGREIERTEFSPAPFPYPADMLDFRAEFPGLGLLYAGQLGGIQGIEPVHLDNEWNRAEIHMAGTVLRGLLNGAGTRDAGITLPGTARYGKAGLYVSGPAGTRIRCRDVGLSAKDRKNALPLEETSPRFEKRHLEAMFYSEAVTAADVNQDGYMDVIAGPNIFMGPDFVTRQEVYIPRMYSPTSYPDPLLASAGDVTGDGYPDILYTGEPGRPGFLYVNPVDETRRWEKYQVIASVDNEIAFADDIDGDGALEYVYGDGGFLGYAKPGEDPTKPWTYHAVTEKGPWGAMYAHGLGTGDINGDGRKDLIQAYGWWEQPESLSDTLWTYHPEAFGRWGTQQGGGGGARAFVYDVNGDGLADVVTSLEAHGFGLAWFEQKRDKNGQISFERHIIMDDFTQPNNGVVFAALHALTLADIDGDGLKDIVTGKRWWAHFGENPNDPDAFGDPVLYWFRLTRENGQVRYVPELINNHTGVGTDMTAADLNNDGLADVMTSTRFGTTIFLSK